MKVIPLLLTLSLAGNLTLSGWEYFHRALLLDKTGEATINSPGLKPAAPAALPQPPLAELGALLKEKDPDALAARVKAADLAPEERRKLLRYLIQTAYEERRSALVTRSEPHRPSWQPVDPSQNKAFHDTMKARNALYGEEEEALKRLGLEEPRSSDSRTYNYLGEEKGRSLKALEKDYAEMREKVWEEQQGFPLPSDEKRLKLLQQEELKDRNELLSAEDRSQLELHESPVASQTMYRFGNYLRDEAEYKAAFAIVKEENERRQQLYKDRKWDEKQAALIRAETESKMKALLGSERLEQFAAENDPDQSLNEAAIKRLHLPDTAMADLKALRDRLTQQARLIESNPLLTADNRDQACEELRRQAGGELRSLLGEEGAATYQQRSGWMRKLPKVQSKPQQEALMMDCTGSDVVMD